MFRRLAPGRLEAADAEPDKRRFHPIDDPGSIPDQLLALPAWASGVFLLNRRDGHHAAVARLAS